MFITRALIAGGGAPEIEVSIRLAEYARTLTGMEAYCVRAFAEALEIIPYTLAENAGLNPIATVTELRNRHAKNETTTGINVRKVGWFNNLQDASELHHHCCQSTWHIIIASCPCSCYIDRFHCHATKI